ncbi:MAG: DUF429 domain-containing protein [Chloroflexi bacterium]|uniref:DUF429 domain-containing protein n=1 Tax=Candidatus Chlorohelix allophototropha TaxID=3003348 RepID=A0A8T7M8F6_9CHLR|nr:DUF429 domain-containing protein [Chloroflexota bacterium]WJW68255.1 DUF429 domain-containing protein [Chloroflexota bacterium L227-S17]
MQKYVSSLSGFEPRLLIPPELLARDTSAIKPSTKLKHYDDLLDAIICAYVAYFYWYWGQEKCHMFGDLNHGYIVTPITPELRYKAIEFKSENS